MLYYKNKGYWHLMSIFFQTLFNLNHLLSFLTSNYKRLSRTLLFTGHFFESNMLILDQVMETLKFIT